MFFSGRVLFLIRNYHKEAGIIMTITFPDRSLPLVSRQIFSIAVPVILQNMAFYIMSFINTAFIGHYDITALSTINNVMFPYMMLFMILVALSQGTTVLIAHSVGAKDTKAAVKIAESSIFYTQIISIGYCLFWLLFGKYVLVLMGVSNEILESGVSYVRVFSLIFLTGGINIAAGAMFQGIGKTRPIMYNTILRAALNIVLDYCLIFGNFGCPRLGLTGAAIASLISATLCNILLFRAALKNTDLPISLQGILRPVHGIYKKVFVFGAQAGMEFMLWNGAQVLLIRMLNMDDQISAGLYGILNTLILLSFNMYVGIGTAAMTLVGHRTGARRINEIHEIGHLCTGYAIVLCIIVTAIFASIPELTIGIFTNNSSVVKQLVSLVPFVIIIMFPKAINVVIGNAIRGTGDVRWMLLTQIIGTVIIVLLSALFLIHLHWGLKGIMIANVVDESWRAVVNYIRFIVKTKIPPVDRGNSGKSPVVLPDASDGIERML